MFIHAVLFEVSPREVKKYRADSLMWARHARQHKGFVSYTTMRRHGHPHQYASVYEWKTKADNDRFMKKCHDWLEGKSKAKVTVLGYYDLTAVDRVV